MTATAPANIDTGAATHPLDLATTEEFRAVREVLTDAGLLGDSVRYCFAGLEEPDKAAVLAHTDGDRVDRRFRVLLLDMSGAPSRDVVVSATRGEIDSAVELDPATSGQLADHRLRVRDHGGDRPGFDRVVRRAAAPWHRPGDGARRAALGRCLTTRRRPGGAWRGCSGSARTTRRTRPGPTPSTGSSPTSTSSPARSSRVVDHAPLPVPDEPGNFDDPEQVGPAAHHPQAHRDHPARGRQLHPRGQPAALGGLGPAHRVQRARGPDPAPDRHPRPAGGLPGVDRRDGGALRRPVARAVLAELLRRGRVHVRPLRELARARLRLPGRDPVHGRRGRRRRRVAAHDHQRDLPARGGLRDPLEALRPVHQRVGDPPAAPHGDLVLHHDRQLRLRLLLVPLPRRHDRVRVEADRASRSPRPTRRRGTRTPRRWRRGWACRTTSTCSRRAWTWPSTASATPSRSARPSPCRWGRTTPGATPSPSPARG